ncbi:hypothetical protein I79_009351 [Cricetulus griseus]|uniref:Uncharacterized protein n=1 Tax=Cricetulus griseus TaxID=10029 RepID=G3HFJ4_CRIGR|nr:hypothetical protein I79_009351 [Cricetulus griseus]
MRRRVLVRGGVSPGIDTEVSKAHTRPSVSPCLLPVDQNLALSYFSRTMPACLLPCFPPCR